MEIIVTLILLFVVLLASHIIGSRIDTNAMKHQKEVEERQSVAEPCGESGNTQKRRCCSHHLGIQ